ncbi:MAG: pyridoxamine 5'-phosphate oxidase family protein [Ilumatobacter sp.]
MDRLTSGQMDFIRRQPMYFVATAAADGRVNVSPKGMDSLRVLGPNRIVWLNLTGSGNETAAHVRAVPRMTLMFMSIDEQPLILRAFGTAQMLYPRDDEWDELIGQFPVWGGSRQIFDMQVTSVRSSCGTGVPVMHVESDRGVTELEPFYAAMSEAELQDYWSRKNTESLDGLATGIHTD